MTEPLLAEADLSAFADPVTQRAPRQIGRAWVGGLAGSNSALRNVRTQMPGRPTAGGSANGRYHWAFTAAGTGTTNYFVIATSSAVSVSWSDVFYLYYGGVPVAGPLTVQYVSVPFAGFVNISFTPSLPYVTKTPYAFVEGPPILPAPRQGGVVIQRTARQHSRAWAGPMTGMRSHGPNSASAYVDFTFGAPQPKWHMTRVQSRWSAGKPMSGWHEHKAEATAGPGG